MSGLEQQTVRRRVPGLCLPLVQRYYDLGTVDVVSVSGCLAGGEVLALHHSRKIAQAPARLGVGSMFEPLGPQPFTEAAVEAVRDRARHRASSSSRCSSIGRPASTTAIDLNPRGFGQMTLDIAAGHDLPCLWYRAVTGGAVGGAAASDEVATPVARRRWPPTPAWLSASPAARPAPRRSAGLSMSCGSPKVGAAFAWSDPLPGVAFGLGHLRHPRAFVRQFFVDVECPGDPQTGAGREPVDLAAPLGVDPAAPTAPCQSARQLGWCLAGLEGLWTTEGRDSLRVWLGAARPSWFCVTSHAPGTTG